MLAPKPGHLRPSQRRPKSLPSRAADQRSAAATCRLSWIVCCARSQRIATLYFGALRRGRAAPHNRPGRRSWLSTTRKYLPSVQIEPQVCAYVPRCPIPTALIRGQQISLDRIVPSGLSFGSALVPPAQRPTLPLPAIFDCLTTPLWLPILLFWAFVLAGLGIYKLAC